MKQRTVVSVMLTKSKFSGHPFTFPELEEYCIYELRYVMMHHGFNHIILANFQELEINFLQTFPQCFVWLAEDFEGAGSEMFLSFLKFD